MHRAHLLHCLYCGLLAFAVTACDDSKSRGSGEGDAGSSADDGKPRIVATTTMVADLARVIAGDHAEVVGLMAPGVDPHSYTLPARAVADLQSADVVLYSGLKLEGRSEELYAPLASSGKPVLAVAELVPRDRLLITEEFDSYPDPHVWGDVALWSLCVDGLVETLSEKWPDHAEDFAANAAAYAIELQALDGWARQRISLIPEKYRTLITSHDAFNYFGRAYGLEVIGVQGISTVDKAGLADIAKTVDLIREREIPAIFGETSVAQDAIQRIASDAGVEIGGLLYSDSLGPSGEVTGPDGESYDPGTYIGMIKHNVNTVVVALNRPRPASSGGDEG